MKKKDKEEAITMEGIACMTLGKLHFLLEAFRRFAGEDETPEFEDWGHFSDGAVLILDEVAKNTQKVFTYLQRVNWEKDERGTGTISIAHGLGNLGPKRCDPDTLPVTNLQGRK